ncbi:MAG: transferase [Gammaproteobacteria bacterium]|jgi:sugar O-acyltransferase (sialic acid O-acetyltransferase NeuD family)|nr:transferase [Gammaproteobacteria bacterium]
MKMRKLYIIGAGAFGREIFSWLDEVKDRDWDFVGFIDDNLSALEGFNLPAKIISTLNEFSPKPKDCFVCAISTPAVKAKIVQKFQKKSTDFINLIHRTAVISKYVKLGIGGVYYPFVYIGSNAKIGDFINVNVSASIGHDVVIGNYSTLSGHCDLAGGVELGEGVFMGTHAAVIPRIRVGDYATIGAGSVAMRHVKPHTTVIGVPAKAL